MVSTFPFEEIDDIRVKWNDVLINRYITLVSIHRNFHEFYILKVYKCIEF